MKIKSKKWNGEPATYAHLKLDGHFVRVTKKNGEIKFETSHPTDISHQIPKRLKANIHRFVPDDTVLLGELHVPGMPASFIKTALKVGHENLRITYFAIESWLPEIGLDRIDIELTRCGLPRADYIRLEDGWDPADLMKRALAKGAEGWMLKDGNLLNWMKLKAVNTVDCVVTDVVEGKGKYLGLVGALVVSVYSDAGELVEIANVGGFDDETREQISDNVPYGSVVEVAYQYVGSGGRLRHPRFVRFRDDKTAQECTKDQVDEDRQEG